MNKYTKDTGKECPAFLTLALIANKWAIRILAALLERKGKPARFSELRRELEGITQRELTRQLREFEAAGLITRTAYDEMPLRVEYALTRLGSSLCDPIEALSRWSDRYGTQVQKNKASA